MRAELHCAPPSCAHLLSQTFTRFQNRAVALMKAATSHSGGGTVFLRGNVVGKGCQVSAPPRVPAVERSSRLGRVVFFLSCKLYPKIGLDTRKHF